MVDPIERTVPASGPRESLSRTQRYVLTAAVGIGAITILGTLWGLWRVHQAEVKNLTNCWSLADYADSFLTMAEATAGACLFVAIWDTFRNLDPNKTRFNTAAHQYPLYNPIFEPEGYYSGGYIDETSV